MIMIDNVRMRNDVTNTSLFYLLLVLPNVSFINQILDPWRMVVLITSEREAGVLQPC